MRDDNMPGSEGGPELLYDMVEGLIVGDEDLQKIAHLGEFGRSPDKVRHRLWRAVPNKDMEAFSLQNLPDPAADNPEPYNPDVFSSATRHF